MFWRQAFSNIGDDKFKKEYQYNIRHSYGLEGGRRNYKPYRYPPSVVSHISCQQIISGPTPGPGEAHGCPFRHFSIDSLVATLEDDLHINDPRTIREIKDAIAGKHYHVACTKVFEATHPVNGALAESINHPNQYFETSVGLSGVKCEQGLG